MEKIDVERLLEQGRIVQIEPQGYSMYPLFVPGRDKAVVQKADPARLKRGDVALYKRDGGILVLHRICRITPEGFYMVGDNQVEVEGPLRPDQIRGVLIRIVRNQKSFDVTQPVYVILSRLWLFMRPVRRVFQLSAAFLKKTIRRITKG